MWEVCAFLMVLPQRGSRSQSLYHGGLGLCGSQCCLQGGPDQTSLTVAEEQPGQQGYLPWTFLQSLPLQLK